MGAADVVPGVSGGTIALVLGIYRKLIDTIRDGSRALGTLLKGDLRGFWRRITGLDFLFLIPLLAGILLAVVSLASLIETQLHDNPEEMAGLFFGLVAASVLVTWGTLRSPTPAQLGVILVVGVLVFVLLGYQSGPIADPSPATYLGAGALAICAMILPGISGSFILLMIGMYAVVIGAVNDRAMFELALLGVGAVIGLALFSSVLGWVLEKAFGLVMAALIGLMLGSLRVLWPWPNGVGVISEHEIVDGTGIEWPATVDLWGPLALAVIAAIVVLGVAKLGERYSGG